MVGFSPESITAALGGSLDLLLDLIKDGTIRGIVGLVSCTTLRDSGQDVHSVAVAEALIKRNLLVLSMGCGSTLQCRSPVSAHPKLLQRQGMDSGVYASRWAFRRFFHMGPVRTPADVQTLLPQSQRPACGVPIPDLPVAVAAPEYMEQKATIDARSALAFGLYSYVNPIPTVTGGPKLVKLLTEDLKDITGGLLSVEPDAEKATDGILAHIEGNRTKLGI